MAHIIIARHGECPQGPNGSIDELLPEAIPKIKEGLGGYLCEVIGEFGYEIDDTTIVYSGKKRTRDTARIGVECAFGKRSGVDVRKSKKLLYGDPWVNMVHYNESKASYVKNINFWLANPNTTEHDGVEIAPYVKVEEQGIAAFNHLVDMVTFGKRLVVAGSHSTMVEPILIPLVRVSGEDVRRMADIGGDFKQGEYASVILDEKSTRYDSLLVIKDREYSFSADDLQKAA